MTLARVQTIKTCMHPARTHSPTDQPSWRHRNRMHLTSSHVPHDRNKKTSYPTTAIVVRTEYSVLLLLGARGNKKKKKSKAANFHACVVRCPSHTDRCSRHESSRCFVLLHGSKTTRPRMTHRCACMWVRCARAWWSPSARHPANTIQTARATRVWSDDGQRRSKLAWWRPG